MPDKRYFPNQNPSIYRWITFYKIFTAFMTIFMLITIFMRPIWVTINFYMGNALNLFWNWITIILLFSFLFILYGVLLILFYLDKIKTKKTKKKITIRLENQLGPIFALFVWTVMLLVLFKSAGSEMKLIPQNLDFYSPILYPILMLIAGFSISPMLLWMR